MNGIINFVLKNKFAVWIMTIVTIVAGLYSGTTMKMESIPNISVPVISLTTIYPGATPEQVAEEITVPLEQSVQNVSGVNLVASSSYQNASSIQIQFDYEKDMDKAEKEIGDAIAQVIFPEGVTKPEATRFSFDMIPILAYGIESDKLDNTQLTEKVEKTIVPALESIEGVQSVDIAGQQLEEVQIVFDQAKLKELSLTEDTVTNIIKGSNVRFPLGVMELDQSEKSVVIDGKVTSIDDLKNIKIPLTPTQTNDAGANAGFDQGSMMTGNFSGLPTVTLGEVAAVNVVGKAESISRTNGKNAISMAITKSTDGNTVEVANQVADKIKGFEKSDGVKFQTTMDMATPVKDSVETMLFKALVGALFAVVIILLFLRNFQATLISIISIPMSLLIAVFVLNRMGISLNMMSLGAMTVAIGRVIDDSIVVIENIYRRMSLKTEKLTGGNLIREATKEMFKPIMSSTLVTIAVFAPLSLVGGMVGELFMPFALAIVFSLLASLLIAITIVPMLAHTLLKKDVSDRHAHTESGHGKLAQFYKSTLNWSLNNKWVPILLAFVLLGGSLALPATGLVGVNFMSSEQEKQIYLTFKPHPGQTLDAVDNALKDTEAYLLKRDKVKSVQSSAGGENPFDPGNNKSAVISVEYQKSKKNFTKEKETVLKKLQKDDSVGVWKEQDFGQGGLSSKLTYYVYGNSMSELTDPVKELEKTLADNKDLKDVESTLNDAYDEYILEVNQEKAAQFGLTTAQIGMYLNPNASRPVVTTVKNEKNDVLSVYIETNKQSVQTIDDILNQSIMSPLGIPVKISDLVTKKEGKTSDTVTRRDGKVYASVSAIPKTKDIGKITKSIDKKIDKMKLANGIEIKQGGVAEDMQEAFTQLGLAMLAAVAIVYLILVITFHGALAPFAILFSLPLTAIGAMLGLWVTGEVIEVSAMIGLLMLIGIVVTNAIVLIDRVIHKEAEGLSVRESLLEAGATRLRPILMTAIATIGALIPLALGMEGSGMISKGLAVTVIGGLTSSTILTLVIVPIVYELLSKLRRNKKTEIIG